MTTCIQAIDIENRLLAVTATQASGPAQVTRFAYDGDGAHIREVEPSGGAMLYVDELYEVRVAGQQVLTRKSYFYHWRVRVQYGAGNRLGQAAGR